MSDPDRLVPFTGDYATRDGHTARFRVIGGQLSIQLPGASFIPLRQVSDTGFNVPFCVDFAVEFDAENTEPGATHDAEGAKVAGGTLVMGPVRLPMRRHTGARAPRAG